MTGMQWAGHLGDKCWLDEAGGKLFEAGSKSVNLHHLQSPCPQPRVPHREGLHERYQTELTATAAGRLPGPDDPEGPFFPRVSMIL